jgi:hypothetical protein
MDRPPCPRRVRYVAPIGEVGFESQGVRSLSLFSYFFKSQQQEESGYIGTSGCGKAESKNKSPTAPKERDRKEGMTTEDCVLKHSSTDPSTAAFLTHIHASLSAREKSKTVHHWQTYPVFVDEADKGFLSDAPL